MGTRSDRPRIGITISRHKSRIARFFDGLAVRRAGGAPQFLQPGDAADLGAIDGLVIGGGDDIGANIYKGEIALDVRIDPERDRMEQDILAHALNRDCPVLGICRGAQMMNVCLGGTLFQDIRGMPREKTSMRTVLARKRVALEDGTTIRRLMGEGSIRVNSLHHQAIDRLGQGLVVSGRDRGDFVQSIERPRSTFFIGVQWHPEFLVFNQGQQNLFRALVRQARQ